MAWSPAGRRSPQPADQRPAAASAAVDPSDQASGSGNASPSASGEATPHRPSQRAGLRAAGDGLPRPPVRGRAHLPPAPRLQRGQGSGRPGPGGSGRLEVCQLAGWQGSAAVIGGRAVALGPRQQARRLADNISALTFGWDSDTLYAVRITRDGANDRAKILEIDFASGDTKQLTTVRYPHPVTGAEPPLREAQFIDDGGLVRIYAVADGNLTLWVLGAPATYRIDPANGDVTEIARAADPLVARRHAPGDAPRGRQQHRPAAARPEQRGRCHHRRHRAWSATSAGRARSNEIVFTLGVTERRRRRAGRTCTSGTWRSQGPDAAHQQRRIVRRRMARRRWRTGGRDAGDRQPIAVELDETARLMRIRWDDGHLGEWGWTDAAAGMPVRALRRRGEPAGSGDPGDDLHPSSRRPWNA